MNAALPPKKLKRPQPKNLNDFSAPKISTSSVHPHPFWKKKITFFKKTLSPFEQFHVYTLCTPQYVKNKSQHGQVDIC